MMKVSTEICGLLIENIVRSEPEAERSALLEAGVQCATRINEALRGVQFGAAAIGLCSVLAIDAFLAKDGEDAPREGAE